MKTSLIIFSLIILTSCASNEIRYPAQENHEERADRIIRFTRELK
jgi:hypothetical protein